MAGSDAYTGPITVVGTVYVVGFGPLYPALLFLVVDESTVQAGHTLSVVDADFDADLSHRCSDEEVGLVHAALLPSRTTAPLKTSA